MYLRETLLNGNSLSFLRRLQSTGPYFFLLFLLSPFLLQAQSIGVTSPAASGTYCAGASGISVVYTVSGTFSNTPAANEFSAQISDPTGSFGGTPVTVGTITSTANGTISCTFPTTLVTSNLYRIRVISSNPPVLGSDNGANLTFFSIDINTPTVSSSSFCRGETFTVTFSQSTCPFTNIPTTNVYRVELSNSSGSFASPLTVGTLTATTPSAIVCTIPSTLATGSGYRVRIVTTNPAITSADNGSNLAVTAPAGTPGTFGNGNWQVHCYASTDYTSNYKGFYTETALSFTTTSRWAATASPSSANNTGGAAYSGCAIPTGSFCYSYKRTNIPCGYYRVDIPQHRNGVTMLINGAVVFQHTVCCDAHTGAWLGVIQTTDNIEFQTENLTTQSFLQVTFTKLNQLTVSPNVRVCSASNASLIATNTGTLPVTYSWTPSATVVSPTSATTIANPTSNTTFTISAYDGTCAVFTNSIVVTVSPTAAAAIAVSSATLCNGQSIITMTASGGQNYTWTPSSGLSSTVGNIVTASPTVNTTYTLIASNNCTTNSTTRNIIVQNIPTTPAPITPGNNVWNVFCYSSSALSPFFGYYTENNLSFTTTTRWAANSNPGNANASSGSAYSGCNLANGNHGLVHARTNFTCGYYALTVNHDQNITVAINSTTVLNHSTSNHIDADIWTGFLGPTSTVVITQLQTTGNSSLAITFSPVTFPAMSQPVTICSGSSATLTAQNVSGFSYSWTPSTFLNTTTGTIVIATATASTIYTCTATDATTGCSSSNTNTVTVNPLPTTSVNLTTATVNCSSQSYTLLASGANTYSWAPSAGLSASSGFSVVASPTASTIYTLTGSNNCATVTQTIDMYVLPLINPTVVPSTEWNAYCYASTSFTNYYGYYTETGSGASGYDFNTTTRWAANALPSSANAASGLAYQGCTMPSSNWSVVYKRSNFACNMYSINVIGNDDAVTIFINGSQVATRATSTNSNALWFGVLTSTSTVEIRHTQTTGTSSLNIVFTPGATTTAVWDGGTSTDWFVTSNWCGGVLPSSSDDVIIPAGGSLFKPAITAAGAAVRNLTVMPAVASNATFAAIASASLTFSGAFDLDIYGDFINSGVLSAGSGRINFLGSGSQSITSVASTTFNNITINSTGPVYLNAQTYRVSGNMNFLNGLVVSSGTLQFSNGATATNASDASFVRGAVTKFGNQAFTFPIGGTSLYHPVTISAPVLTTDNFRAIYVETDVSPSFTHTAKDASIDHISRCEYWLIDRTGGSSVVYVTLGWNLNSCGINAINDLIVARWDAGQVKWKDHGNGATTGNANVGTVISSAPIVGFSPFTIASKSPLNPLPIELLSFNSKCVNEAVVLEWRTASEKNNSYFELEKSADGATWITVKRINSAYKGGTTTYQTIDSSSEFVTYYRLRQVDTDGTSKTFPIIASDCEPELENSVVLFPVPVEDKVILEFHLKAASTQGVLQIINSTGKVLSRELLSLPAGITQLPRTMNYPAGVYFMRYDTATGETLVKKFIVK